MKKFAIFLSSVAVSASVFSQTTVGSDIVGYSKVTVPSNQLVLIATTFDSESNTVAGVFGSLPAGSVVSFWDASSQQYRTASKTRAGWGSFATNSLVRGEGVFVRLSTNLQQDVLFSGNIPTNGTTPVYPVKGLSLLSYPYPVSKFFTNTVLATSALNGDVVSFWSNGWSTFTRTRAGWGSASNVSLKIGQAFYYSSSTNVSRTEVRPYNLN